MGTGTDAGNAPGAMGGRMGGEPTTAIGISVRSLAAASGAPALPSGARRELRSVSLAPRCSRFVR